MLAGALRPALLFEVEGLVAGALRLASLFVVESLVAGVLLSALLFEVEVFVNPQPLRVYRGCPPSEFRVWM